MPHILILHASLGTGHTSAANALGGAFSQLPEVTVQVVDALDHASSLVRTALTEAYRRASESAPLLYKLLYESSDADDIEDSLSGNRLLSLLERPFLSQLDDFVEAAGADAIICTHPLPAHVLRHYRKKGRLPQPLYLVVTDFMAHSTWLIPSAAGYFLPSDFTRDVLIARRVPPELLHVTGMPVHLESADPKPMAAMRRRHQLPLDGPLVTLFGGGLDPERVRLMVTRLLESPTPGMLIVVAGRNEALVETLADLTDGPHMRLHQLGLIDYVDDLVAASDLIVTKAGGLIVSEVLARETPMVIIDPLPGQEEWNADFVAGTISGIQLRMPEMVPPAVLGLLAEPERLAVMAARARRAGRPRAAVEIAGRILADLSAPARSGADTSLAARTSTGHAGAREDR